jgi:hypothetical protein
MFCRCRAVLTIIDAGGKEEFQGRKSLKRQTPGPLIKEVNGRRSSPPQNCPQELRYEGSGER